jgi:hypothetical protein
LQIDDPPDSLDLYRIAVERHLANCGTPVLDENLEAFFDHVIEEFERGSGPADCAANWLQHLR